MGEAVEPCLARTINHVIIIEGEDVKPKFFF